MGNPNYQRLNATGTSNAVIMDWTLLPFNASWAVTLLGNTTASYRVNFTLDDPNGTATVTWFDDANTTTDISANLAGNYIVPVRALRLNCSALAAAGTIQFAVLQGLPE